MQFHEVTAKVDTLERVMSVSEAIQRLLEYGHKKKDYVIDVPLEMLKQAEHTKRIFSIVLGSIAAISLLVGVVFGIYPARRAAQMDPVEALRHE